MDDESRIIEAERLQFEIDGILFYKTVANSQQCNRAAKRLAMITRSLRFCKQVPRPQLICVVRSVKHLVSSLQDDSPHLSSRLAVCFTFTPCFRLVSTLMKMIWQLTRRAHSTALWSLENEEDTKVDAAAVWTIVGKNLAERYKSAEEYLASSLRPNQQFLDFRDLHGEGVLQSVTGPEHLIAALTFHSIPVICLEIPHSHISLPYSPPRTPLPDQWTLPDLSQILPDGFSESFAEDVAHRATWFHPGLLTVYGTICARETSGGLVPVHGLVAAQPLEGCVSLEKLLFQEGRRIGLVTALDWTLQLGDALLYLLLLGRIYTCIPPSYIFLGPSPNHTIQLLPPLSLDKVTTMKCRWAARTPMGSLALFLVACLYNEKPISPKKDSDDNNDNHDPYYIITRIPTLLQKFVRHCVTITAEELQDESTRLFAFEEALLELMSLKKEYAAYPVPSDQSLPHCIDADLSDFY